MELIVKKSPYPHKGRRIPVGGRIEVSSQLGRVLLAVGLASVAPPVVAAPPPKVESPKVSVSKPSAEPVQTKKRAYVRRDLTAED